MSQSRFILGVDPGIGGGAVLLDVAKRDVVAVAPWMSQSKFVETVRQCIEVAEGLPLCCYLEAVHAMPKQGVVSVWTFAENFGFIKGVLASLGVSLRLVTPQKWQAAIGAVRGDSKTSRKNNLKDFATRMYPAHKPTLKTADAFLIATYGMIYESTIPTTEGLT